jgi:hypothetical protein
VTIPVQDANLELAINGTQIVWDIDTVPTGTPRALNGSIINGMLGGYVLIADAAAAISQLDLGGAGISASTLRGILSGQADMDVTLEGFVDVPCTMETRDADCLPGQLCESNEDRAGAFYCYETPDNADAISLALTFSAVSCEITGIWHDTPTP